MIRHTLFAASFFAVTCALQAARVTIQETTDGLILSNGPVTLSISPQTASWILDEQPRAFLLPHLTNTSVSADWAVDVRRGRAAKTVWLGVQDPVSNVYRAIGFTLTPRSAAPQCIWLSASAPPPPTFSFAKPMICVRKAGSPPPPKPSVKRRPATRWMSGTAWNGPFWRTTEKAPFRPPVKTAAIPLPRSKPFFRPMNSWVPRTRWPFFAVRPPRAVSIWPAATGRQSKPPYPPPSIRQV